MYSLLMFLFVPPTPRRPEKRNLLNEQYNEEGNYCITFMKILLQTNAQHVFNLLIFSKKNFLYKSAVIITLNLTTSSILAILPSLTQDWKKLGATLTPIASEDMPVCALSEQLEMARNVPNKSTKRCWATIGSDAMSLKGKKKNINSRQSHNIY